MICSSTDSNFETVVDILSANIYEKFMCESITKFNLDFNYLNIITSLQILTKSPADIFLIHFKRNSAIDDLFEHWF